MEHNTFKNLIIQAYDALHEECFEYIEDTLNIGMSEEYHHVHEELIAQVIKELYTRISVKRLNDLQK